jgi:hypothetical protein
VGFAWEKIRLKPLPCRNQTWLGNPLYASGKIIEENERDLPAMFDDRRAKIKLR